VRKRFLLIIALTVIVLLGFYFFSNKTPPAQQELENQFSEMMTGATLVGQSTRLNKEGISGNESYAIDKITRLAGDTWLLQARIQYGTHDVPVPVPVKIKWAGDTPVITLTDLTIPGLGTYTARVLLYRDQYAGTWSAQDHGGQIFGKIVRRH
jgi:hypothetical protein